MSILDWLKIYDNQRVLMISALFILVAIPFIKPMGLPIVVSDYTTMFYDGMENIQSNDVVVVDYNFAASNWGELGAAGVAMTQHLSRLRRDIDFKIIFLATTPEGPFMVNRIIDDLGGWSSLNFGEYGVDWVYLGFMAGGEPMIAAMASDFNSIYQKDYQGTSVTELPLMMQMTDIDDVDLLIQYNMGGDSEKYRTQWGAPFGTSILMICQGNQVPRQTMYVEAGQITGMVASVRGAAEYELLLGLPGEAIVSSDALSTGHILVIAVIILGNINYFFVEKKSEVK